MRLSYQNFFKPAIDILFSLLLIILSLPLFCIITFLLFLINNGNPFFVQKRIGKNLKLFHLYKFKTMNEKKGVDGKLLPDQDRLTSIGKFIRKTSMDELPQLINILKGDMSLIGPRPLLPEYVPYYDKNQIDRHKVKSGITGWAQVNGRNAISWERRFELDLEYVNNISFALDVKIVVKTIFRVMRSEGISAEGYATMPMFSEYIERKRQKNE